MNQDAATLTPVEALLGDSITYGYATSGQGALAPILLEYRKWRGLPPGAVLNLGKNGYALKDIAYSVDNWVESIVPGGLFRICIGHNDAKRRVPASEFASQARYVNQRVFESGRRIVWNLPIYIHASVANGWPPWSANRLMSYIRVILSEDFLRGDFKGWLYFFANRQPDGVHPNDVQARSLGELWARAASGPRDYHW